MKSRYICMFACLWGLGFLFSCDHLFQCIYTIIISNVWTFVKLIAEFYINSPYANNWLAFSQAS